MSLLEPFRCRRFTLRVDGGFLAATPGIGGPPITVVSDARDAVHFVDAETAVIRARLMTEIGWDSPRVVEVLVPPLRPLGV